jgi:hypothetical protein
MLAIGPNSVTIFVANFYHFAENIFKKEYFVANFPLLFWGKKKSQKQK